MTTHTHTAELPVCCKCNQIIPELEIYYTLNDQLEPDWEGNDYCQNCAYDVLNAKGGD